MRPDPFEMAIDEQLRSVFPQPEFGKKGEPTIELYKIRRRRPDDILVEMADKMRSELPQRTHKKGRKRRRRRGPKVVVATFY